MNFLAGRRCRSANFILDAFVLSARIRQLLRIGCRVLGLCHHKCECGRHAGGLFLCGVCLLLQRQRAQPTGQPPAHHKAAAWYAAIRRISGAPRKASALFPWAPADWSRDIRPLFGFDLRSKARWHDQPPQTWKRAGGSGFVELLRISRPWDCPQRPWWGDAKRNHSGHHVQFCHRCGTCHQEPREPYLALI